MQFEHTDKVTALIARLETFFDEHIYPTRRPCPSWFVQRDGKARWEPISADRTAQAAGARERVCGTCFCRIGERRRRPDESRVRAAVRGDGPGRLARRGLQLLARPTPATWKCWSATPRQANKERWLEPLLAARSARRSYDRAGGRVVRRHQHRVHPARRRPLRDQRPQVVVVRRRRYALQVLIVMGKTDPAPRARAAVADPRAARHAGRAGRAHAAGVRLRRRAARPRRDRVRERARAASTTCCSARAAASRSPRGGSGPGRIHHCMRNIGVAERRSSDLQAPAVARRVRQADRRAIDLAERIANSRIKIDRRGCWC